MFHPLAIFIGLRYTRAKRRQHFISFIALISMLGIALGTTVLITVLSVLNGFDREIKKQVFSLVPPLTINSFQGEIKHWQVLSTVIQDADAVTAVAPYASGFALLASGPSTQPVTVIGILPDKEKGITAIADKMVEGDLNSLLPSKGRIVLGQELATNLGLKLGDEITLVTQRGNFSSGKMTPRSRAFVLTGLFKAGGGGFAFDSKYAFIHLADAQLLFDLGQAVTALHASVQDIYHAPFIAQQLESQLPPDIRVASWAEQLGDFFQNIRSTKSMMFLIFVLIIAVAAFNLICTMVMAVRNKRSDVAILRTFGATPNMIMGIFLIQGASIGLGGTLFGILGGLTLSYFIPDISIGLQNLLNLKLVNSQVYFVNYLPSKIEWQDVWQVSLLAFLLSLLATLYPAWRASRLKPAQTLRGD